MLLDLHKLRTISSNLSLLLRGVCCGRAEPASVRSTPALAMASDVRRSSVISPLPRLTIPPTVNMPISGIMFCGLTNVPSALLQLTSKSTGVAVGIARPTTGRE